MASFASLGMSAITPIPGIMSLLFADCQACRALSSD